ncbi:trimethyllysine dioxygenase [Spinellus fusiger]|nr:trimethyllysine dioxygenase [Spinellus fusiger]
MSRLLRSIVPRSLISQGKSLGARSFSSSSVIGHKPNATKRLQGTGAAPQRTGLANEKQVFVDWNSRKTSLFHHFWLRDHCRCDQCFHPLTRQRIVDTFSIPKDIQPVSVESTESGMHLVWADGHKSTYPWDWLHTHSYSPILRTSEPLQDRQPSLWDASLSSRLPTMDFEQVMNTEEGLASWLEQIEVYGLSFVDNVPVSVEGTESLARRLTYLRQTFYSQGMWSMSADLSHADTAYTTEALPAHTDNTYFTEPSGLQMFHKIKSQGTGGDSLFVDGFAAAHQLKQISSEAYRTLSQLRVPAHAAGDKDIFMIPSPRANPILNLTPRGELFQVRYNNNDRSTLNHFTSHEVEQFYDALFMWKSIITDKKNELWLPLTPGRAVIFDNWRVMHGRSAYTGDRQLCGAYFPWDDYKSKARSLRMTDQDKDRLL